ncbi:MAG: succinyldiaminopimelate transaminase [Gammaproteobacteria bacterium]|nr:succinyldiaminopimelate transaminase [Gammaproteobacteria bacterium]
MNPRLDHLQPYPFERLNALLGGVTGNPAKDFIPLSLGEPKHETAHFLIEAYRDADTLRQGLATYPPTKGLPELRSAIAAFVNRRFHLDAAPIDPETQILPVNGTREALFAIAQAVIDPDAQSTTLIPNPFYQIYEGAALIAGSRPVYVPCPAEKNFKPDFASVTEEEWSRCAALYLCTPGNPTGAVMSVSDLQAVIRKSDEYDFVIISDECYSELYDVEPPPGLLEAAAAMGRTNYRNCIAVNSLSKRSNLPGLRSGYACGDALIIERFLLYRTYHGSAMPVHNQLLRTVAWRDETHVEANRKLYRRKYDAVAEVLGNTWPMETPAAGFYLWPETPVDDETFTVRLLESENIKVVPGSYLGRERDGRNPGSRRVRMALVATLDECIEAAERLKGFIERRDFAK